MAGVTLAFGLLPVRSGAATFAFTTLRTLNSAVEGSQPVGPLVQGADGLFYGTLREDGQNSRGAIFRLDRAGNNFDVLTAFPGVAAGAGPESGLVQARDGNFYGTTFAGGGNGFGTLFQITPDGVLTNLANFNNSQAGANPSGTLLLGLDGNLYGTATFGGSANFGTAFRASVPDGVINTLSAFGGSLDGSYPQSDLLQASDGNFYGSTTRGGAAEGGTFFRLRSTGARDPLFTFSGAEDGAVPLRGAVQGADGNFYGIAQQGGAGGVGTIYRISPGGAFSVIHTFSASNGDGYGSFGNLVLASDGRLYGATALGGPNDAGVVFSFSNEGDYNLVYAFTGSTDGRFPRAGLVQGADGNLYGTTAGINGEFSTIFRIDLGLPAPKPVVLLTKPNSVKAGDTLGIAGDHFVGTSAVNFVGPNNTALAAASFTVRSRTYLEAVVPAGAVSGVVTVTANGVSGASGGAVTVTGSAVTPPAVTPSVTITAADPVAAVGNNLGRLKFTRAGDDATAALTVKFVVTAGSTAIRGVDYDLAVGKKTLSALIQNVTIPAGQKSVTVKVQAIDTGVTEPDRTAVFKVKKGSGYKVGVQHKATVFIVGNS